MTTHNVRDDQLPTGAGAASEVLPVPAASVLVLRDNPFEVLMLRRHEKSSFVPNAWVFPGGVAEQLDHELGGEVLAAMRVCAARELFEETGVWLGAPLEGSEAKRRRLLAGSLTFRDLLAESPVDFDQLVWTSRWITPIGVPKRFDTYFFLTRLPDGATPSAEFEEAVEVRWVAPSNPGDLQLVFPTLKNLEAIASFTSAGELLDARRGAEIPTTRPKLIVENGQKKIVLP